MLSSNVHRLVSRGWLLLAAGALALAMGMSGASANLGGDPAGYPAAGPGFDSVADVPAKAPCSHPVDHQTHASCVSASCPFDSGVAGADGLPHRLNGIALRPHEAHLLRGVGTALPFHPPRTFTRV